MLIRTGLLFVPAIDEETSRRVRHLLQKQEVGAVVVMESQAGRQRHWIAEILRRWCDEEELDLVLTVGGTRPAPGHSEWEPVPEATKDVVELQLAGFGEEMRRHGAQQDRRALLDRSIAGIRARTIVINLPSGTASAMTALAAILDLIEPVVRLLQGNTAAIEREEEDREREQAPGAQSPAQPLSDLSESHTNPADSKLQNSHGLDASEFAAFLRRKKDSDPDG